MIHFLYVLNKEDVYISKSITYIRKNKIKDINNIRKCNFIKNLSKLYLECDIIIDEASSLST